MRNPDPAARELLARRAALLARPQAQRARPGEPMLTFALGYETYALAARWILAVFPLRELARLPGAEPPLFGVTPWRGTLLTIADLRMVLGVGSRQLPDLGRVIVLEGRRGAFGILADATHEMVAMTSDAIHPPVAGAGHHPLVRGITDAATLVLDGEGLIRILDTGGTS